MIGEMKSYSCKKQEPVIKAKPVLKVLINYILTININKSFQFHTGFIIINTDEIWLSNFKDYNGGFIIL